MKSRHLAAALLGALLTASLGAATPAPNKAPAPAADSSAMEDELDEYAVPSVYDPLEGVNRAVFRFNDGFYTYVARPVSTGYEHAVPEAARIGVGNVLENALFPVRFAGSLLQGKFTRAAQETGKFLVNSTVGVAGFVKVSEDISGLSEVPAEDAGQVLGYWGVPAGPYLVVPFLGPTTARDFAGNFADRYATPWNWDWWRFYEWEWATAAQTTNIVNGLPSVLRVYDSTVRSAADPYIAVRTGFTQYRNAQIRK